MKIDRQILDSVFLRPQQDNKQQMKSSQVDDFAALLNQGADQKGINPVPAGLDEGSAAMWANSLLGKIQAEQATTNTQIAGVEDEIGGVLDMLDQYMNALGDPNVTLKEIAPLVEDLDRSASRLDKIAGQLGQDSPIKQLTNETAVLAAVEALKFKRGDFV